VYHSIKQFFLIKKSKKKYKKNKTNISYVNIQKSIYIVNGKRKIRNKKEKKRKNVLKKC